MKYEYFCPPKNIIFFFNHIPCHYQESLKNLYLLFSKKCPDNSGLAREDKKSHEKDFIFWTRYKIYKVPLVYIPHKGRLSNERQFGDAVASQHHPPSLVDDPLTEWGKGDARKSAVTCGKIRASCVGYRWVALDGPLGMPFSDFPLLPWSSMSSFSLSFSLFIFSPCPFSFSLSRVFHTCTRECVFSQSPIVVEVPISTLFFSIDALTQRCTLFSDSN